MLSEHSCAVGEGSFGFHPNPIFQLLSLTLERLRLSQSPSKRARPGPGGSALWCPSLSSCFSTPASRWAQGFSLLAHSSNKNFWASYQPLSHLLLLSFNDTFVETDPIFTIIVYIKCFYELCYRVQEGQWDGVCFYEELFSVL